MHGGCLHGETQLVSQVNHLDSGISSKAAQHSSFGQAPPWLKRLMPPPPVNASGPQPRGFGAVRDAAATRPNRQPAGYHWGAGQRLGDS